MAARKTINMHGVRVLQDGNLRLTPLATWPRRTKLSRMISLRLRALALASAALSILSCGSSNTDTAPSPAPTSDAAADAAIDAAVIVNHSTPATTPIGDGGDDVGSATGATASDGETDAGPSTPQTFIRVADWTPDAPSAGFDLCLAPAGTSNWAGPLLAQTFPAGSLGQGGANGLQFPAVTKYFGVAPGQYDIQLVASGATDCTTGLLAETDLPALAVNAHTTFATVGDVNPRGNDTGLKIAAFFDDVTVSNGQAAVRVINAIPSVAYLDVGTGSLMAQNFAAIFTSVGFAVVGETLADGGTLGITGYLSMAPATNAQFSAHATGTETTDTATATHVSLGAGSATTMAVVNGANNGFPPQFLVCTDNATPSDEQTPCMVYAQ
jgi:hypothetical protein